MPVTEHAQRRAARADALVTAQLAFALNSYSFDGLAERHRQTLNREALLRQASTPLQRYMGKAYHGVRKLPERCVPVHMLLLAQVHDFRALSGE